MELKVYTNEYGFKMADCPFCSKKIYIREGTRKLSDLERHITTEARREAFEYALKEIKKTPHLSYIKEHSKTVTVKVKTTRSFDKEIKLV